MSECFYIKNDLILNSEENQEILSIKGLRALDLKAPLLSLAEDICKQCPNKQCSKELDLVNDKNQGDWTVTLIDPIS